MTVTQVDDIQSFADLLRSRKGVESRSAVLHTDRLDIIRGKDFARWYRENSDLVNLPIKQGKKLEEQIPELATLLIRKGLLIRCQRKFHKPPPGQKRLIKFPKKVLPVAGPDGQKFDESGFYAWTYEKPTPTWVYVVSALSAVGVILICLFPIAPAWVKISVVYFLSGLLTLLIGALLLRGAIALASYIFTGRTVWILPNVLDDNKPVSELFDPLIGIEEPETSDRKTYMWHLASRLGLAGFLGGLTYVLYTHSPGQEAVKRNAFKYRDELFEFLNVHNTRNMISKGQNDTQANETLSNNTSKIEL